MLSQINKLYEFTDENILKKSLTFKQYEQEYNSRNKDNPLKFGNNDSYISFGQELLSFLFYDYMASQNFPKQDTEFPTFSDINNKKQQILSEEQLSQFTEKIGLNVKIFQSKNQDVKGKQKIQSQAIKALIGAHYFDKQKDLNKIRKIANPIFQILLNKQMKENSLNFSPNSTLDESQINKPNPKGEFYELMKKKGYSFGYVQNEQPCIFTPGECNYNLKIIIENRIPISITGTQKKETERQLFSKAIQLLNNKRFNTEILESYVPLKSSIIQTQEIDQSVLQTEIRTTVVQNLEPDGYLDELSFKNEKEIGDKVSRFLDELQ